MNLRVRLPVHFGLAHGGGQSGQWRSLAVRVIWPFPTQSDAQFWSCSCRSGHEHWMDLAQQDGRRHLCCAFCRGGTGIWRYYGGIVFSRAGELTAVPVRRGLERGRPKQQIMCIQRTTSSVLLSNASVARNLCECQALPARAMCTKPEKHHVFQSLMKCAARDWCPHDECVHRFSSASTVKGVCPTLSESV